MNYRGFFWVLVTIAIIGLMLFAVVHKIWRSQPAYDHYLGSAETPVRVAERVV